MDSRRSKNSSSRRRREKPKPLTNGEVVEVLRNLPQSQPFGVLEGTGKREFFRQLYVPLHSLFNTTTSGSQAIRARIRAIAHLEIPSTLHGRFHEFEKNPLEFWEARVEKLPPYSSQESGHRVRIFLEGAAQLDSNIEEQLLLRRFVAVAAYNLFRRAFPTSSETRVFNSNIKQFLTNIGLPNTDANTEKYGIIIRRGQRLQFICRKLKDIGSSGTEMQGNISLDNVNGSPRTCEDYGPLFFPSIPDTLWEPGGLRGKDIEPSLKHLQRLGITTKSETSNARHMANILLGFHARLFWVKEQCQHNQSGKDSDTEANRARKRPRTEELPTPRREPTPNLEFAHDHEDSYTLPDPLEFDLSDFDVIGPQFDLNDFDIVDS